MHKISSSQKFNLKMQQILGSRELKGYAYQKSLKQLLVFLNFQHHLKNKFVSIGHSCDTFNFRFLKPDWSLLFWSIPTQKIIYQSFIFLNWYPPAQNQSASLICSGHFVHLKILQSDWQRAFWPIEQEQDFYQT